MADMTSTKNSTVIPCLRYHDAPAAIEWLCRALGFEKRAVHANPDGTIAHAELTLGGGMVMLGSVADSEYGRMMVQPGEIGKKNTQSSYMIVSDADAAYRQAKAAGAEIVLDISDKPYGRDFTCRDLEGHLWSLGSYDPWAEQSQA